MKVYNQTKTILLENYNLDLGYLVDDVLTTITPEVQEVKEQGHYETIKVYPNGGKDVKWVVDVPGVNYQPEKVEKEDIKIYIPYTAAQLAEKTLEKEKTKKQEEINDLKDWFDTYYAQHEQKYRRLIALGKLCDDGTNPSTQLTNLYLLAEANRLKINELEKLI